jgi:hypothetical protein
MRLARGFEKKGGRKPASFAIPGLEDNFVEIVSQHTAGDPMRDDVVWTYYSTTEIARELKHMGTPICTDTVRSLLDEFGFHRRQAEKTKARDVAPFRNEQFENIARLKQEYLDSCNPILSMDTKKKEHLGELFRAGRAYANGPNAALDHDFLSDAKGTIIPHGIYDLKRNMGHLTLGTSHDTSQFACDSLGLWWHRHGARAYPYATSILLLCDGGGSNNSRHYIFKEDLLRLANRLHLSIRVAHYPPYCSKYNPIEHRLFPHVTRAWSGVLFRSLDLVTNLLRRVSTSTGLKLTYAVLDKVYQLKREASQRFLEVFPITFHDLLPEWNYTIAPYSY